MVEYGQGLLASDKETKKRQNNIKRVTKSNEQLKIRNRKKFLQEKVEAANLVLTPYRVD
jgi:hypothetical protein